MRVKDPIQNRRLIAAGASLALFVVGLAMLWPVFRASAERIEIQELKSPEAITAPMKRIDPVSVAIVNFKKLAEAEANNKAMGIKEKTEPIAIDPPLSIPEPQ